jgi:hypothetical protein
MLSDTSPEAERVQLEILRKMSVAERMGRVRDWTRMLVHLSREGLARANPGVDKRELDILWVEQQYGRDLAVRLREYVERKCRAS